MALEKRDGFFLVQIGIADERGKRNHRSPGHLAGGKKPKCSPIASLIVSFDSPQPRSNAPESPTLLCKVGPSYTRKKSADQATKTENQAQVSRGLPHTHARALADCSLSWVQSIQSSNEHNMHELLFYFGRKHASVGSLTTTGGWMCLPLARRSQRSILNILVDVYLCMDVFFI